MFLLPDLFYLQLLNMSTKSTDILIFHWHDLQMISSEKNESLFGLIQQIRELYVNYPIYGSLIIIVPYGVIVHFSSVHGIAVSIQISTMSTYAYSHLATIV